MLRFEPKEQLGRLFEAAVVLGILAFIVFRYLSYDLVKDPDPEGYVSYANFILDNWSLPSEHRRLPGYPFFLAIIDSIGPFGTIADVYWTQCLLMIALIIGLWWKIRKEFGKFVSAIFLGVFTLPNNYFVYFSTFPMSDLLRQFFLVIHFFLVLKYLKVESRVFDYKIFSLLAINGAVVYAIHPGTKGIFLIFLLCIGIVLAILKFTKPASAGDHQPNEDRGLMVAKLSIAGGLFVMTSVICQAALDRGSSAFYQNWSGWRVAMCLPPASSGTLSDQIESAKSKISERIGYPIEYERPNVFPEMGGANIASTPPFGATSEAWLAEKNARLRAYPTEYIGCMARELLYRHYDIVTHYTPWKTDNTLIKSKYRIIDDSPASWIFRTTGIDILELGPASSWDEAKTPFLLAIANIFLFYILILIGLWQAASKYRLLTASLLLTAIAWSASVVTMFSLEPRYLLPFAPLVYLLQALAISSLVRKTYGFFIKLNIRKLRTE